LPPLPVGEPDVSSPPHDVTPAAQPMTIAKKVNRTLPRMRCMKASVVRMKQDRPRPAETSTDVRLVRADAGNRGRLPDSVHNMIEMRFGRCPYGVILAKRFSFGVNPPEGVRPLQQMPRGSITK
jgi:hypothetical protein